MESSDDDGGSGGGWGVFPTLDLVLTRSGLLVSGAAESHPGSRLLDFLTEPVDDGAHVVRIDAFVALVASEARVRDSNQAAGGLLFWMHRCLWDLLQEEPKSARLLLLVTHLRCQSPRPWAVAAACASGVFAASDLPEVLDRLALLRRSLRCLWDGDHRDDWGTGPWASLAQDEAVLAVGVSA